MNAPSHVLAKYQNSDMMMMMMLLLVLLLLIPTSTADDKQHLTQQIRLGPGAKAAASLF